MEKSRELRELLHSPGLLVLPGAYDGVSALLIARAGFPALFSTGFGIAASHLGLPDLGLLTANEMVERAKVIACTAGIPVLADMDTGYGDAVNVTRTLQECERAGIAGVILEDQEWPKRCGHMEGKQVIPAEDFLAKLRAARAAAPEMVIVARTDARATDGLDEAIRRGRLYAEAGADAVFVEAPVTEEELRRVAAEIDAPLVVNMVEGGKTPVLGKPELEALGFAAALYPVSPLLAASAAVASVLAYLADTGSSLGWPGALMPFRGFEDVVRAAEWRALDSTPAPPAPEAGARPPGSPRRR